MGGERAENFVVEMRLDVKVSMRDGVDLSADIYMPTSDGPFPAVLMRTPYSNNADSLIERARNLANVGYACVIQDVRGPEYPSQLILRVIPD